MTQKVIRIPTLNDSPHDFAWLFGIWNEANNYFGDIRFDFIPLWFSAAQCRCLSRRSGAVDRVAAGNGCLRLEHSTGQSDDHNPPERLRLRVRWYPRASGRHLDPLSGRPGVSSRRGCRLYCRRTGSARERSFISSW